MNENEIKLEARLAAIEYMLGHTLSRVHIVLGTTEAQFDAMENNGLNTLDQTTFPGVDPALADMFSAEIKENVERILATTREMMTETNKKIGR